MLYTRKGDNGTTKTFGCDQRISKSSAVAEALGALDEANSFIGIIRAQAKDKKIKIKNKEESLASLMLEVQQSLFIVQAEVAGSKLSIVKEKTARVEMIVDEIEKILPPIKNFFIPGASVAGAEFDFARTLIRRAERRAVGAKEESKIKIDAETLSYLNRLSSLFYALARISSHLDGVKEVKPKYE